MVERDGDGERYGGDREGRGRGRGRGREDVVEEEVGVEKGDGE